MNKDTTEIILGPPGTGKTTTIMDMVEAELKRGTRPDRIGFVSFTKRAVEEGVGRATSSFNLSKEDFPHFRTLHSVAFRELGMSRRKVFGRPHLKELGDLLGMELTGRSASDDDFVGMAAPDRMLFMENLARSTFRDLKEVWESSNDDHIGWYELERLAKSLAKYKASKGLLDFTDMVNGFIKLGRFTPLEVLYVDEAQDLSQQQWRMVDIMSASSKRTVVVGDDDQALYQWAGADVSYLMGLEGSETTLSHSYRVPRKAHALADHIINSMAHRRKKSWSPRESDGTVSWASELGEVDMSTGSWLVLTRNNYMIPPIEQDLMGRGFNFSSSNKSPTNTPEFRAVRTWESLRKGNSLASDEVFDMARFLRRGSIDTRKMEALKASAPQTTTMADLVQGFSLKNPESTWLESLDIDPSLKLYFSAARRRGEKLLSTPRIRVSTIHSAKGAEADHVVVFQDISKRCADNMDVDPDPEHRVFYVATTRCRESLTMILPSTDYHYDIR